MELEAGFGNAAGSKPMPMRREFSASLHEITCE
jgi:hypothetical protein